MINIYSSDMAETARRPLLTVYTAPVAYNASTKLPSLCKNVRLANNNKTSLLLTWDTPQV